MACKHEWYCIGWMSYIGLYRHWCVVCGCLKEERLCNGRIVRKYRRPKGAK